MNPVASNPYLLILEADPEKYIKTPASVTVVLFKALEGTIAFLWCFRMLDCLRQILGGGVRLSPLSALCFALPSELTILVLPQRVPVSGAFEALLGMIAALCVLIWLLCVTAEAAAAVLLCVSLQGAKLLKTTRKWILAMAVVLCLCVAISGALQIRDLLGGGLRLDSSLQPLMVTLLTVLLLILQILYLKDAATVIAAVEYEIRLGFKETGMDTVRLGLMTFLLGLLFLAAAGSLLVFTHVKARHACAFAMLAVKYFAVGLCWRRFRKLHR